MNNNYYTLITDAVMENLTHFYSGNQYSFPLPLDELVNELRGLVKALAEESTDGVSLRILRLTVHVTMYADTEFLNRIQTVSGANNPQVMGVVNRILTSLRHTGIVKETGSFRDFSELCVHRTTAALAVMVYALVVSDVYWQYEEEHHPDEVPTWIRAWVGSYLESCLTRYTRFITEDRSHEYTAILQTLIDLDNDEMFCRTGNTRRYNQEIYLQKMFAASMGGN